MARITVSKAAKQFNVSRTTIYKLIKEGKITRDSDNNLDVSDLVRLFSVQNKSEPEPTQVDTSSEHIESSPEHVETPPGHNESALVLEIEHLKQQVAFLEKQLEYVKANEAWLKQQLDQKLLEHKSYEKKSILSRFFK